MKSFKHALYVALIAMGGCSERSPAIDPAQHSLIGSGADPGGAGAIDFTAYVPKLPEHVDRAEPLARTAEPMRIASDPAMVAATTPTTPTTPDAALAQGRILFGKGDVAGAKSLFESAVKLDARSAEPHIELARLYIASHERGHAIAEANKAVQRAPLSSQAWNTKGRAELHRFSYDDAILAFSRATELNPGNVWAWNNLGYTELQLKKYGDAAQHLVEATTRPGATAYMFNNLGTALEHLDRLEEARAAFEAGGKLGSMEALASRKRLDGVKSIALVMAPGNPELVDSKRRDESTQIDADAGYEHSEAPTGDSGVPFDNDAASDGDGANADADGSAFPSAE